jgi:hypothetical protein
MTTKHTPTPWVSEGSTQDGDFTIYNAKTFDGVLDIHVGTFKENNLSLILAAPELLDALLYLLAAWERTIGANSDETYKAKTAIAKALGNTE